MDGTITEDTQGISEAAQEISEAVEEMTDSAETPTPERPIRSENTVNHDTKNVKYIVSHAYDLFYDGYETLDEALH